MSEISKLIEDVESYQELESLRRRFGKLELATPEYGELPQLALTEDARRDIRENRKEAHKLVCGRGICDDTEPPGI